MASTWPFATGIDFSKSQYLYPPKLNNISPHSLRICNLLMFYWVRNCVLNKKKKQIFIWKKTLNCVHLPFLFPSASLALLQLFLCLCLSLILFPLLCVHFILALFLKRQPLWGNLIVKWSAAKQTAFKMNGTGSDNPSSFSTRSAPTDSGPLKCRHTLMLTAVVDKRMMEPCNKVSLLVQRDWLVILQTHQHTVQHTSLLQIQQLHFLKCYKIYNVFH